MRTFYRLISRNISKFSIHSGKKVQHAHFARRILGCGSLALSIAKCTEVSVQQFTPDGLTPDQCIKQACLLSVNSASALLTTTSSAVLDICKEYKNYLNRILTLLEQFQGIEGENPQLWDAILEERANVNKAKAKLTDLSCYMETVEKVVNSTTEAAFLAGAEYICTALCERLYSAQKEINDQIVELKKLEEDYVKIQKEIVSTKYKDNKGKSKLGEIVNIGGSDKSVL